MPSTGTGTADPLCGVEAFPSCPSTFDPQQRNEPSARSAQAWSYPAVIAVAVAMPLTSTGVAANVVVVPSPRWPDSPSPQHFAPPLASSAQPNSSPAITLVAAVSPLTVTSTEEFVNVPS